MLLRFSYALLTFFLFGITLGAFGQAEIEVIATVNGVKITTQQLDNVVMAQIHPLQQQIYAIRKAALENLITRALLEEEAGKRGITVEEFKKTLSIGKVEVSVAEVEKEYSQYSTAFAQMSPDEAKERIRLDLENQAKMRLYREAVTKLRNSANITRFLKNPYDKISAETISSK
jgi:hypothetical protein